MWFRSFGCLLARKMGRKVKSELCELCFSKFRNASDSGGDNAAVYTAVYWDSQFEKHTVWSFRSSPNWSICFQNLVEFLPIQQAPLLREDSISRLFQKESSKSLGRFPKTTELVFFGDSFNFWTKHSLLLYMKTWISSWSPWKGVYSVDSMSFECFEFQKFERSSLLTAARLTQFD